MHVLVVWWEEIMSAFTIITLKLDGTIIIQQIAEILQ